MEAVGRSASGACERLSTERTTIAEGSEVTEGLGDGDVIGYRTVLRLSSSSDDNIGWGEEGRKKVVTPRGEVCNFFYRPRSSANLVGEGRFTAVGGVQLFPPPEVYGKKCHREECGKSRSGGVWIFRSPGVCEKKCRLTLFLGAISARGGVRKFPTCARQIPRPPPF